MNHKTILLNTIMRDEYLRPQLDKALSTYPLYVKRSKEEYIPSYIPTREELNKKILNHYKYREIGFETIARFLDELEISMNEIMPYYNQMFVSIDQDFNIIYNVDYTRKNTLTRDKESTNVIDEDKSAKSSVIDSGESTSTGKNTTNAKDKTSTTGETTDYHKNIKSDTPQDELSIGAMEIDNLKYASSSEFDKNNGSTKGTSTGESDSTTNTDVTGTSKNNSTSNATATNKTTSNGNDKELESSLEEIKGNYGQVSAQALVERYRENIINVEQQIINDPRITELFMLIY